MSVRSNVCDSRSTTLALTQDIQSDYCSNEMLRDMLSIAIAQQQTAVFKMAVQIFNTLTALNLARSLIHTDYKLHSSLSECTMILPQPTSAFSPLHRLSGGSLQSQLEEADLLGHLAARKKAPQSRRVSGNLTGSDPQLLSLYPPRAEN